MATKKKAPKKRSRKKPIKLEDFSPAIRKKARSSINMYRRDSWSLRRRAEKRLPGIPAKKKMVSLQQRITSGGRGWTGVKHSLDLIKTKIDDAEKILQEKGALDIKIHLSYEGILLVGTRMETDAEFEKRSDYALFKRALILTAKQVIIEVEEAEQRESRKRNRLRHENAFKDAVKSFSKEDLEQLMAEALEEKNGKKKKRVRSRK